jgi:hypothetical protein
MDALPTDMSGTTIGFGDKVAYAVTRSRTHEYSALRVGRVYGMRHDPIRAPGDQVLVQVENELADGTKNVVRFGTRRLNKLIVIEKAKE